MNTQSLLASLVANNLFLTPVEANQINSENIPIIQNLPRLTSTFTPHQQPTIPPTSLPIPSQSPIPNTQQIIKIRKFIFQGNTVFSNQELEKLVASFVGKEISFSNLLQVTDTVTNYYVDKGYINSGAYLPVSENQSLKINEAVVTIGIVEGKLEQINIIGGDGLRPTGGGRLHNYIRARIPQPILNNKRLLSALQLLQQDPLLAKISASLKEGTTPDKAVLNIYVTPRQEFKANVALDNYRSPATGSFQRRLELSQTNLLGLGDTLSVGYRNTDGSNALTASYSLPLNHQNGTIGFSYANISNNIIEEPFTTLDIVSDARLYELTYRQPLLRQASATSAQEFALGLTASRLENESSLQNTPFPISAGADPNGRTRVSAVRFSQDWTNRSTLSSLFVRSQFSWGLDAFDSTINTNAPDGRFFSWFGEGTWLRRLGDTSLLMRTRLQLADRPLPSLEQFSLGGINRHLQNSIIL
ncbi:ShlB/FhaC/HecB family hemolysin secretion/activation protein [Nostoc sp. UHCC 0870]|uniref:ShlB/FhaC/HecB family hemolysin secretion/activation protein n=1 Tax=Nostoc sp. UHCC 0870 TaxID=2914041 RepID=UPI001EDE80C6|nr:ShlB/FhaC/HecB family hemolysin secretion/activation protein [Nostoc sp. UHCC 0870]UKP01264.1 ShlB/FhaC/HecB family hemolysin secretion/activation protein [Nostoc sp. UHCC 0870]